MPTPIPAFRRYGEQDNSLTRYVAVTENAGPLQIVRWQESEADFSLQITVIDDQSRLLVPQGWRVRLWWADVARDVRARPTNHSTYGAAQSYSMATAFNGIENVRASGMAYAFWVEDERGNVISPTVITGNYENHTVLCPVYLLPNSSPPPVPQPPQIPIDTSVEQYADTILAAASAIKGIVRGR